MRKRARPKPPESGKVEKTKGWEALGKLLEKKSQTELAKATKVAQSAISAIWKLQQLPSRGTIFRLQKLGIQAAWWDQRPERRAA